MPAGERLYGIVERVLVVQVGDADAEAGAILAGTSGVLAQTETVLPAAVEQVNRRRGGLDGPFDKIWLSRTLLADPARPPPAPGYGVPGE
jgi:hypothetical protein